MAAKPHEIKESSLKVVSGSNRSLRNSECRAQMLWKLSQKATSKGLHLLI